MTEILRSPPQQLPSTSISNVVELSQVGHESAEFFSCGSGEIGEEGDDQLPVLAAFLTVFRKSLVGCRIRSGVEEQATMEIGGPTNVRHVAHVTFDRFNGFLGLPVEFEPEVPRRPPSASTRVFGVSTESMQLSFDSRGNCVPTILLMMQQRLYSQRGLESEGIFRINPENGQEEYVREQLNNGLIPDDIDVHCLAGLIKAWFRELPKGVLDCVEAEQVMQAQSEEECCHVVSLLPPTEAALLDWAINLMADVAQMEHLNKMNARNVAMVFAPNMTQMSDPLTALMYAVQVMNFLKTLIEKTLRQREECEPVIQPVPSDDDPKNKAECEIREEEEEDAKHEESDMLADGKGHFGDMLSSNMRHILEGGRNEWKIRRSKSRSWNEVRKGLKKNSSQSEGERDKEHPQYCYASVPLARVDMGGVASHELIPPHAPLSTATGRAAETHLWYVNPSEVKSESLLKQYLDILSPCERENVLRLQGKELRKSALLARALVRTTIAKYQMNSPVEPRSLKFRKNVHGKPEVCWPSIDDWDPPPLQFNLSHTSSLIACGVTINSQIGIDVEEKKRSIKHDILSFARRYFSKYEVELLAAISDPQVQQREFIKLWTLKEAYVKALGKGFSGAPFKTFTIRFQGVMGGDSEAFDESSTKGFEIVVDSLDDPTDVSNIWQFSLLELDGSHYAAICTEKQSALDGTTPQHDN
ncbi:hypothetical protein SASPL_143003 [Salvia splendens]|uniref:Rho GTPase-activating protein 1 n=1 Tax=Salvia splendens TaxID=180675 RepID=A0A8X8WLC1_SALSN|nr:hypothetical protein SASPL_143003 [Salvia splendens]